ncbi:hypothetical protein GGI07_000516 [Coemansia sp. Benny D115]|nr:hypothetical protein GGI07_000516 [Coemansia sp. Benny D115]
MYRFFAPVTIAAAAIMSSLMSSAGTAEAAVVPGDIQPGNIAAVVTKTVFIAPESVETNLSQFIPQMLAEAREAERQAMASGDVVEPETASSAVDVEDFMAGLPTMAV